MTLKMTKQEENAFRAYEKLKNVCNACEKRSIDENGKSCRSRCMKYRLYEINRDIRHNYIKNSERAEADANSTIPKTMIRTYNLSRYW